MHTETGTCRPTSQTDSGLCVCGCTDGILGSQLATGVDTTAVLDRCPCWLHLIELAITTNQPNDYQIECVQ